MASVNKVILLGNLGGDPEVRYTASGAMIVSLSLATSRKFNDKQGNKQEKTEWHRLTVFGKLADVCAKYLSKGKSIYVEGRIEYGSYEKDGIKRYTTDIIMEQMTMLSGATQAAPEQDGYQEPPAGSVSDDIPF